MTGIERVKAALELRKLDRVPVGPLIDLYSAVWCGITGKEFISNRASYAAAMERCWKEIGEPDWLVQGRGDMGLLYDLFPLKLVWVGDGYQVQEQEMMTIDDYDFLIEKGYGAFMATYWPRIHPEWREHPEARERKNADWLEAIRAEGEKWVAKGVEPSWGGFCFQAFDMFCQMRSHAQFVCDVFRRPDKVMRACQIATEAIVEDTIQMAKETKLKKVVICFHRSAYFNPKQFEKFSLPFLKQMVDAFLSMGLTPVFHCDGNWNAHVHYLLELPKAKCIVQFDGLTDIFRAKEILRGHMCIHGDVPAALTTLGTSEEVTAYCRKLIDVVGADGGFILGSGCDVPVTARRENVTAMVKAAKEYSITG